MSCLCQGCGSNFKVDFLIDDCLWEKIKPADKPRGSGLLCGVCILKRIEDIGKYDAFRLLKI